MENLALFSAKEVKRAAAEERERERGVFLCRSTVGVEVNSKVIPTSFLKIEERETFVRAKKRRKRNSYVQLVGDQSPSPKAPPRSKRGVSKKNIGRRATIRGAIKKSWGVSSLIGRRSEELTQPNRGDVEPLHQNYTYSF